MSRRLGDPLWNPKDHVSNGYPTPWIARWSEERGTERAFRGFYRAWGQSIPYTGYPLVLQGQGEADHGSVDTFRFLRCMNELRCQVCGARVESPVTIIQGSSPLTFLAGDEMAVEQLTQWMKDGLPTGIYDAPVCDDCLSVSQHWCPQLSEKTPILKMDTPMKPIMVFIGPLGVARDSMMDWDKAVDLFKKGLVVKQVTFASNIMEVVK